MHHAANVHRKPLETAPLEPLHELPPMRDRGECPFLGKLAVAARGLSASIASRFGAQARHFDGASLDSHTLADIGLTRPEAADWGPVDHHVTARWAETDRLS